jgi:PAS domain S-box-containing protein
LFVGIRRDNIGRGNKMPWSGDGNIVSSSRKKIRALEEQIEELRQSNEVLKLFKREFEVLAKSVLVYFAYVDARLHYRYVNKRYEDLLGVPRSRIVGKHIREILGEGVYRAIRRRIERTLACKETAFEVSLPCRATGYRFMAMNLIPDCGETGICEQGTAAGFFSLAIDLTEQKALREELDSTAGELKKKDIALGEVIEKFESEKIKMRQDVVTNIRQTVLPILRKLRMHGGSRRYIDLLELDIEQIADSFGSRIADASLNLSRREIEICDMIRDGLTSKEIAGLLRISIETVHNHRRNIRRKLGISREHINLTAYLHDISRTPGQD